MKPDVALKLAEHSVRIPRLYEAYAAATANTFRPNVVGAIVALSGIIDAATKARDLLILNEDSPRSA